VQLDPGVVQQPGDQRAHVVGAARGVGQQGREVGPGRDGQAVPGRLRPAQQQRQPPGLADRLGVGLRHHVHDPGAAAVRFRPAEPLGVDILAGHATHDVRTGDENPALAGQDDQVGEGRAVGGAARGRAEHHRDLRDLARGPGHGREHRAHRVQALHALAQPGAARVPQPDDRRAGRDRVVVSGDDRRAARAAQRAALHLGVAGERHRGQAVDGPGAREHPVGGRREQQRQRPRVEQGLQAGPRVPGQVSRGRVAQRRRRDGMRRRGGLRGVQNGHVGLLASGGRAHVGVRPRVRRP
jgi:hypothetical protein